MQKLFIILSLFAVTMTYAAKVNNVATNKSTSYTTQENASYEHMSTSQLQEEVEKHSINGDLSFNMGLELIRRWTKN